MSRTYASHKAHKRTTTGVTSVDANLETQEVIEAIIVCRIMLSHDCYPTIHHHYIITIVNTTRMPFRLQVTVTTTEGTPSAEDMLTALQKWGENAGKKVELAE